MFLDELEMVGDDADGDRMSFEHECFYYDTIDRMADLIIAYGGRDRVMADVTEAVVKKLQELGEL